MLTFFWEAKVQISTQLEPIGQTTGLDPDSFFLSVLLIPLPYDSLITQVAFACAGSVSPSIACMMPPSPFFTKGNHRWIQPPLSLSRPYLMGSVFSITHV